MTPYTIAKPTSLELPVVISVPHCGTAFPAELIESFKPELIAAPDDTDWFVDKLYDFAPSMGFTMISSTFSRWVIDLNRDPQSKPLYTDGRIITGLCPTTDFLGNNLYLDERTEVDKTEVERRLKDYYWPYHHKLTELLQDLKRRFGSVLLWDCHSIRQQVPTIQKEKFPDLILGTADGISASENIIDIALKNLRTDSLHVNHNHPFKGGFITRNYGNPSNGVHALQLEMTKVNYMDDTETKFDTARAEKMRLILKRTLGALAENIST